MSELKTLLFDLDGTLVRTREASWELFRKTNEKFGVLGGALGSQTLDADGVKALSELPSLDQLRAKLLGMIQTPGTRIAGILQAPGGQLSGVGSTGPFFSNPLN